MKRLVIIGATSGIGLEVAKCYLQKGWKLGLAGRRTAALNEIRQRSPEQIEIQTLDVTHDDAPARLNDLIHRLGGMDVFLLSSGIGFQNPALDPTIELNTHYFAQNGGGHLAVISSIAGTKGLGVAPAYSATKRFQNTYIDALEQLSHLQKLHIHFTDIRPGFVATALLGDGKPYPMLMRPDTVAQHIVRALERRRRVVVIDARYRVLVGFWRLIPRWLWKRLPIKM